jgi:hypothetical protein
VLSFNQVESARRHLDRSTFRTPSTASHLGLSPGVESGLTCARSLALHRAQGNARCNGLTRSTEVEVRKMQLFQPLHRDQGWRCRESKSFLGVQTAFAVNAFRAHSSPPIGSTPIRQRGM